MIVTVVLLATKQLQIYLNKKRGGGGSFDGKLFKPMASVLVLQFSTN